jgi:hydroxyacylglutathione hydrolase
MNEILIERVFFDNYVYLYKKADIAIVIDPGRAEEVLRILKKEKLRLSYILATHHHDDHTGGIEELKNKTACKVISSDIQRIPQTDIVVSGGQITTAGGLEIEVIATPGHTKTSVCFYIPASNDNEPVLFTGDTLFIGGCGRIFECDAKTMWQSLNKIAALPDNTLVYPGHNYTVENYEFALTIEPNNTKVTKYLQQTKQLLEEGRPSVPSTIAREKQSNIFLRSDTVPVRAALGIPTNPAYEVFGEIRRKKDSY